MPFTSFAENEVLPDGSCPPVWFALDESRPSAFFAGIWRRWTSVRKVKEGETTNDLFAFLTTEANAIVAPIHPKAMPVILTTPEAVDRWLEADTAEALTLKPDSVAPVAPHEAFLSVAVGLISGAMVLAAASQSESSPAFALVSGQLLECSLKAFLSKRGLTEEELKKDFGHDLLKLWAEAVTKGLPFTTPPKWVETLDRLHDAPWAFGPNCRLEAKPEDEGEVFIPDTPGV